VRLRPRRSGSWKRYGCGDADRVGGRFSSAGDVIAGTCTAALGAAERATRDTGALRVRGTSEAPRGGSITAIGSERTGRGDGAA
jgi:hypothetical protein